LIGQFKFFRKLLMNVISQYDFLRCGNKNKFIRKTYFTYTASYLAQTKSFAEIFQALVKLGLSENFSWTITLKQKRGLTDTSQPGGFTKDIVYFEGVVAVWDWIHNQHNDPKDLYLGRISLDQVALIKQKTDPHKTIYPTFFENMQKYSQHIKEIGEINKFVDLLS